MSNEIGLEDAFVTDRLGTAHRAIDVFRTGEFQGAHNERLRIIKLLEADLCTNSEWGWTDCYGLNKEHCERLKEYIELIKGESNA